MIVDPVECPVARAARLWPTRPALVHAGGSLDYAALDKEVHTWHAALLSFGLRRGDRVGMLAENRLEVVALLHAAARAGVGLVLLNARLTRSELAPLAERAGAKIFFASAPLSGALPGCIELETPTLYGPAATERCVDPSTVHAVLFTSGTSGTPKAAQLTVAAHQASALAAIETLRIDGGSRYLCCLPLFHVGGAAIAIRCAIAGAALILHERFDAAAAGRALAEEGATHVSLVGATLQRLLDAWPAARFPASVRAALIGGGPAPAELLRRAAERGLPALLTYGLTEAASQVTCERLGEADGTTSGAPQPGTEVRIVDARRRPLAPGEIGEIEVRGPTLMSGYLDDPAATAEALPGDGWLRTRDLGALDRRGRLTVHARRSDLILSGGENVYPAEVEAALLAHPRVAEAAVVPVDDATWGQVPGAAVVARGELTTDELQAHCRGRLAGFKLPSRFAFLRELPRTAAGKIDRAALSRLFQA